MEYSANAISQRVQFLSRFSFCRVVAYNKATKLRLSGDEVEVIHSKRKCYSSSTSEITWFLMRLVLLIELYVLSFVYSCISFDSFFSFFSNCVVNLSLNYEFVHFFAISRLSFVNYVFIIEIRAMK